MSNESEENDNKNDVCDKLSVVVALDEKRKLKKVFETRKWGHCLRLANDKVIGTASAAVHDSPSISSASVASTAVPVAHCRRSRSHSNPLDGLVNSTPTLARPHTGMHGYKKEW